MRIALDTNIVAYAEGINGTGRQDEALDLIQCLPAGAILVPVQVLGELFNILVRKAGWTRASAQRAVMRWCDAFPTIDTTLAVMATGADLASAHRLGIWDAVIFSAASAGGCRLLLSEDMQEGFTWGGVTVTNPFAPTQHVLLRSLLHPNPGSAPPD